MLHHTWDHALIVLLISMLQHCIDVHIQHLMIFSCQSIIQVTTNVKLTDNYPEIISIDYNVKKNLLFFLNKIDLEIMNDLNLKRV